MSDSRSQERKHTIAGRQLYSVATKSRLAVAGGTWAYLSPCRAQYRPGHDVSMKERHHTWQYACKRRTLTSSNAAELSPRTKNALHWWQNYEKQEENLCRPDIVIHPIMIFSPLFYSFHSFGNVIIHGQTIIFCARCRRREIFGEQPFLDDRHIW